MHTNTLKLILSYQDRRPNPSAHDAGRTLDNLFTRLTTSGPLEGDTIESAIWETWMSHDDPFAKQLLETAVDHIVMENFDEAEAMLNELVRANPDFAEAWNKRATLYYLLQRDQESIADIDRVLDLEPRHFGAMCHFAQICLAKGDNETALYALDTALRLNPHLDDARATARRLVRTAKRTLQ